MSYNKLDEQFGRLNIGAPISDAELARKIQAEELSRYQSESERQRLEKAKEVQASVASRQSQLAADEALARKLAAEEYQHPNAVVAPPRPVNYYGPQQTHMKWQFLDSGVWKDWPLAQSKAIEKVFLTAQSRPYLLSSLVGVNIRSSGRLYFVDFKTMQQVNITSGAPAPAGPKQLRRIVVATNTTPSPQLNVLLPNSLRWEYYDNAWCRYPVDASKSIELIYQSRGQAPLNSIEGVVIRIAEMTYNIDFRQQKNRQTGTTRNIRRVRL